MNDKLARVATLSEPIQKGSAQELVEPVADSCSEPNDPASRLDTKAGFGPVSREDDAFHDAVEYSSIQHHERIELTARVAARRHLGLATQHAAPNSFRFRPAGLLCRTARAAAAGTNTTDSRSSTASTPRIVRSSAFINGLLSSGRISMCSRRKATLSSTYPRCPSATGRTPGQVQRGFFGSFPIRSHGHWSRDVCPTSAK